MFQNILRTFAAEMFKTFKNIQPQPKIRRSYKKKSEFQFLIGTLGK